MHKQERETKGNQEVMVRKRGLGALPLLTERPVPSELERNPKKINEPAMRLTAAYSHQVPPIGSVIGV